MSLALTTAGSCTPAPWMLGGVLSKTSVPTLRAAELLPATSLATAVMM